jgi:hypothetical protein
VFRFRIRIGPGNQRFTEPSPDPDPRRPKLSHREGKKCRNFRFKEPESPLKDFKKTFMTVFDPKNAELWIRDPGSGIGFFLDLGFQIRIQDPKP